MAFNRALAPKAAPESDALTSAMVGIGMAFAAPAAVEPNIEDTLRPWPGLPGWVPCRMTASSCQNAACRLYGLRAWRDLVLGI